MRCDGEWVTTGYLKVELFCDGCKNGFGLRGILRAGVASEASRGSTGALPRFKGMTGSTRLGKLYLELKPLLSASKTQLSTKYIILIIFCLPSHLVTSYHLSLSATYPTFGGPG